MAVQIAKKFVSSEPKVMVGIGTMATQALVSARQHNIIPIVFSSVTDPMVFKSAKISNNSNNQDPMITGVSNYIDPGLQFDLFKKILPNLTKLGIIYNPGDLNSVILVEMMKKISVAKNLQLEFATANNSATIVQAIFVNNDNTALSAFKSIVITSTKYKVPVFCSDIDTINEGALAALGANQYEIGKQTGELIIKILKGEKISTIPVVFPKKTEVHVNFKQADELGIQVSKNITVD